MCLNETKKCEDGWNSLELGHHKVDWKLHRGPGASRWHPPVMAWTIADKHGAFKVWAKMVFSFWLTLQEILALWAHTHTWVFSRTN